MLEDESKYNVLLNDILNELGKFGCISSYIFPRPSDLHQFNTIKESAIGKIFVEFEEVAAAFVCYNMLYQREFMGQPVTIDFFAKD